MNSLDQLTARIGIIASSSSTSSYPLSVEEVNAVVRWVRIMAELARREDGKEEAHLLSSPARLLGHISSDHVTERIDGQVALISDAYARVLVKNAMEWSNMDAQGKLPPGLPPDLFEPLLSLLGCGCQFRLSKGFLEVGDKAIPIHRWPAVPAS
ncbi:MAG: hypothetical protein C4K60_15595 [Ideonella sp. MAG2]|nr:MAG: hypothetical protein C4K60_15595 [Ideonella sp. MAG2]